MKKFLFILFSSLTFSLALHAQDRLKAKQIVVADSINIGGIWYSDLSNICIDGEAVTSFADLTDVMLSALRTGDVAIYDSISGKWQNVQFSTLLDGSTTDTIVQISVDTIVIRNKLTIPRRDTSSYPVAHSAGRITFSPTLGNFYGDNGTEWLCMSCGGSGGGSGTVYSIVAGWGLNGGTITSAGTIDVDSSKVSTKWYRDKLADSVANAFGNYVPTLRTITINGVTYDISANRSWTITAGSSTLAALTDVNFTSLADQQLLKYDHATSKWINFTPGYLLGVGITGATKTKITYNSNGLVTSGADATTSDIAEGSNLYYTDARARAAISLTTTGSSGAATYNSSTGVLNIPQYSGGSTYSAGTGLTLTSTTFSNNLSTGVSGGQTLIGSTSTNSGIIYKATSGVGTTGANHVFTVGNNGVDTAFILLNNKNAGFGVAAPSERVEVNGNVLSSQFIANIPTASNGPAVFIKNGGVSVGTVQGWDGSGSSYLFFGTNRYWTGSAWAALSGASAKSAMMFNMGPTGLEFLTFAGGSNTAANVAFLSVAGKFGVGVGSSPTAFLHAAASTTSTASVRIPAGTAPSSPNDGDMWQSSSNLKYAVSSTTYTIPKTLTGSATLDFSSTSAQNSADLTITVTGASDGDIVMLGVASAAVNANTSYTAWVSASNTVTVRLNNYSSGSVDPASATFKVSVIK